ncbi:MAG: ubiquinone-binding protein [Candidatus Pelagibacter sp.]|nr:ubiquinone-binding protein [Candidatus Pelagibacter sp.]RPG11439.1 MAG: type II toxin-antitoxin system RatA family toxin [Pelagibacteraceae bacterium TMED170]
MSSASIKKIISCKKNQLIEMVLDIEKYPEFVPWCIEGKIHDKNESQDLITFNGDLKVGKSILNETFSSHVSYFKEKDKIIVTNLDGPLKHLKNEWKFKEVNNATQLEFFIDFELKNPILNAIMKKSFDLGLSKIANSFEERAVKLYK